MRVWLDDTREMPEGFDVWCKTANECLEVVNQGGVTFLSFDHDLGEADGDGYLVAKFIEEKAEEDYLEPFGWEIHSQNPVGEANIRMAMENAEKSWQKHAERKARLAAAPKMERLRHGLTILLHYCPPDWHRVMLRGNVLVAGGPIAAIQKMHYEDLRRMGWTCGAEGWEIEI